VQTELALDKIKVIRNDLHEADIEVAPAANKKKPDVVARVAPAPKTEPENAMANP
jgi:hypothetical protein